MMLSLEIGYQGREITVLPHTEESFVVDTDLGFGETGITWIGARWDGGCAVVRAWSLRGVEMFSRSGPAGDFVGGHLTRVVDLPEVRQWDFPGDRLILLADEELRLGRMGQDQIVIRHQNV